LNSTGVISSTLVSIGTDLSQKELTTLDKSLITSCTSLFALIASPISGVLADKLGRKKIILIADVLFTVGALWQAFTSSVWSMILGRSIVGLAIGGASLVVPLYISELSPSHLRGRLVVVSILFITGGQVVAYVIGWLLSSMPRGWRWMVGLGAVPAIVQFAMLIFLPETPRWLVKAGHKEEARRVLANVYGVAHKAYKTVERVLRDIEKEILEEEEATTTRKSVSPAPSTTSTPLITSIPLLPSFTSLFSIGANRRALTIACMLQGLQQLCGFNSLMYFSATIFSLLNFSSPTLTSLSIAVTNFTFTLLAFTLIDRVGRRRILLYTLPIMILALLICGLAFSFMDLRPGHQKHRAASPASDSPGHPDPNTRPLFFPVMILISLILYVSAYATGLGNVPWQQSELFALSVRSTGSALATATNWFTNTIVGLTFLPMLLSLGGGWTFVVYACVCVVGWVGVWWIYPETRGLSLEDVGGLLATGWGVEESLKRDAERKRVEVERGRR
jgi:MFS transporter, SP family, solute carrier family 2 (myo-inositol transporter), member 13